MNNDAASVAGAKLVGGVWLPADEGHFVEMMERNKKNHRVVDGKLTYQYRKLEDAMNRIPKSRRRVAVDVGAHVGLWAMWLVREFRFVHCIEPVPLHCDILQHNMPTSNYDLHRVALGAEAGRVRIEFPRTVTGNAHVVPGEPNADMVTLDSFKFDFSENHAVDFIKIDVEGFELQVVRGAKTTLLEHRPYMVLEQKGNDIKLMGGKVRNEALDWCKGIGMRAVHEIGGDWFLDWGAGS